MNMAAFPITRCGIPTSGSAYRLIQLLFTRRTATTVNEIALVTGIAPDDIFTMCRQLAMAGILRQCPGDSALFQYNSRCGDVELQALLESFLAETSSAILGLVPWSAAV